MPYRAGEVNRKKRKCGKTEGKNGKNAFVACRATRIDPGKDTMALRKGEWEMANVKKKLAFLKEIREDPGRYLPITEKAWNIFPKKDCGTEWYDDPEYNIGWDAGLLEGNRPYFLECWATCGITMLTYFVSSAGMKRAGKKKLIRLLEDAGLLKILDPHNPRTSVMEFTEESGNSFYSVNIVAGDEEHIYTDGGCFFPYEPLNEFNREHGT